MAEVSVMHQEMEKWLRAQTTCVAAGITLFRENESFRRATPIIYRDNLRGLVTVDDLKIPHSELAIHQGAAGKDILAFSLTGTQTGMAVYDKGDGKCEYIFGREDEIFSHALIDQVNKMWRKVGPEYKPEEVKLTEHSSSSNPGGEVTMGELKDKIRMQIQDEQNAFSEYRALASNFRHIDKWEIATIIDNIANDESEHKSKLGNILRELGD